MKTLESMGVPVYVAMSPKTYEQMKEMWDVINENNKIR